MDSEKALFEHLQVRFSAGKPADIPHAALPAVVARNHERPTPCWVLGRTKRGGFLLVSFDPEFRKHRVKSGAEVVEIEIGLHARLMSRYQQLQKDIQDAIQKSKGVGREKGAAGRPGKVRHPGRGPGAAQEGG